MTALSVFIGWTLLSIVAGPIIGRFLRNARVASSVASEPSRKDERLDASVRSHRFATSFELGLTPTIEDAAPGVRT